MANAAPQKPEPRERAFTLRGIPFALWQAVREQQARDSAALGKQITLREILLDLLRAYATPSEPRP